MNSIKSRKHYINGVLDGPWREYHDNKNHTLKIDGHYVNGEKDGLWEEWYDDDKEGSWDTPYDEAHTPVSLKVTTSKVNVTVIGLNLTLMVSLRLMVNILMVSNNNKLFNEH